MLKNRLSAFWDFFIPTSPPLSFHKENFTLAKEILSGRNKVEKGKKKLE